MLCATLKQGLDCAFMTKKGCDFNGGSCKPVLAQCEGCERLAVFPTGKYCLSFPDPTVKWRRGPCNMA
ncbi:MAG: PxxKW family cysteine-rich protein, partial [Pseudomonadota bacterium]